MNARPAQSFSILRTWWMACLFAVVTTSFTVWLRVLVYRPGDPPLLMLFLIPIMFSAYVGGMWPGLLATVVATLEGIYYLLPPQHSFAISRANVAGAATLILDGVLINVLVTLLRSNRDRLKTEQLRADELKAALDRNTMVDITRRKQAEERAVWLASFPERNPNPIMELDAAKELIHYVNPTALRLFPELVSQKLRHPLVAGLQDFIVKLQASSEEVLRREVEVGALVFAQTITHIPETGRLRVYSTDITALKRAEATQQRLADIVNSSDDAIISKTLEGIITSWNPGAQELFGYTAEEVIGRPMLVLFPPDRLKEEADILARIARGESLQPYDTIRVRKDGVTVDVSVTVSPLTDSEGRIIGASKIARDITVRKKIEARLR
ncbi:MAG TPA: PAS domain S-box protein, partial [Verrucomicrobiae bacterium]|nr:PAS domain S-box protein [Verrucomicrobiae bacterium]